MSERKQFETWYAENKDNDWLWRVNKVDAYHVWQASRRAALEEAAKVCDEKQDWYEKDRCIGQATAVGACADEIRALAASDSEGGKSK
jgi:hypothetical protein